MLRQTARTANTESREIDVALAFIHNLPPNERITLLRERLESLQPRRRYLEESVAGYEAARTTDDARWREERRILREAPWVVVGVKHSLGRVVFEMDWMEEVLVGVADWPRRPG